MLRPCSLVAVLLFTPAPLLFAQASPSCPMHPETLAAMRHCYRPLLVFSRSASDPRFHEQENAMDNDADDMMDRNVLLVPILVSASGYRPPLDTPSDVLPAAGQARLRRLYGVAPDVFRVILLDEDGRAKVISDEPMPMGRLNGLIDTLPQRKREMQEPNTN